MRQVPNNALNRATSGGALRAPVKTLRIKLRRYQNLKRILRSLGYRLLMLRPRGLACLGPNSMVQRPRTLRGRGRISIGADCMILSHSLLWAVSEYGQDKFESTISIGNNVYIGRYLYCVACDLVVLGDGCVLSEHVYLTDFNHGYSPDRGPILAQPLEKGGPVIIGANTFVGYRATILPGVSLGEWCVVAAHSVVTKSFPAYSMLAGAPARVIKIYSAEQRAWIAPESINLSPRNSEGR